MSQTAPIALLSYGPTIVSFDTPCRKCGYNLRGLGADVRCPECGIAVAASVSGNWLRYCDPVWVMRLARGTKLILAGYGLLVLAVIVQIVIVLARGSQSPLLIPCAGFCADLLMLIGSWWVTSSDPSGIGEDRYGQERKIIRFTLIFDAAETVINATTKMMTLPPDVAHLMTVIEVLGLLVGIVGLVAQLQYYDKLGERIPDRRLSKRADLLKKTLPVWWGGLIANVGVILLFQFKGPQWQDLMVITSVTGLAALLMASIYFILYLLMIKKFGERFTEQALLAAQNWATHARVEQNSNWNRPSLGSTGGIENPEIL